MKKEKYTDFVHLHVRSHFSRGEGICTPRALLREAGRQHQSSIALTDRNILAGIPELHKEAIIEGINPVSGMEILVDSESHLSDTDAHSGIYPLVLLAQNKEGYHNLVSLSNIAQLESCGSIKRVDKESLACHYKGLIALSGGLEGEISQALCRYKQKTLLNILGEYLDIYGKDNFFLELQDRAQHSDISLNKSLCDIARRSGTGVVATADVRYLHQDHLDTFILYREHITGSTLYPQDIDAFHHSWMHSTLEINDYFKEIPQAINNTLHITDRCQYIPKSRAHQSSLPDISIPGQTSPDEYLSQLCRKSLEERFSSKIPLEYHTHLSHELKLIKKNKQAPILVLYYRLMKYTRGQHISTMSGQVAASLVAWLLDISTIDPVQYQLIPETWLSGSWIPDIRVEIQKDHRTDFIIHLIKTVGLGNIRTSAIYPEHTRLTTLKTIGKILGVTNREVNDLMTELKFLNYHTKDENSYKELKPFHKYLKQNDNPTSLWIKHSLLLSETALQDFLTDSCGYVISKEGSRDLLPLYQDPHEGLAVTQYTREHLKEQDLFSINITGLHYLDMIRHVFQLIQTARISFLDDTQLSYSDPATWDTLSYGETRGIFGLDNKLTAKNLSLYKPENLLELATVYACSRPGLGIKMQQAIDIKGNPELQESLHTDLDPILRETQGVLIFTEQLMHLLHTMSGQTMTEILAFIKSIKNGRDKSIKSKKEAWMKHAVLKGYTQAFIEEIVDLPLDEASLLFSKARALSAVRISYLGAWLKTHYYAPYMEEVMAYEQAWRDNSPDLYKNMFKHRR